MNLFTVQCEVNYKLSANKTINLFPVQNRNLKKNILTMFMIQNLINI